MSVEQEVIDIIVEQLGVDREEVAAEKSFVEDLMRILLTSQSLL